MRRGWFIGEIGSWIGFFILVGIFTLLFTLRGCAPSLQQSQLATVDDLDSRYEELMLLRQPVEYFGQDVTLAYVLGRVAIKEEAEVRKQAIRSALEQAHGWQRDKYCIIVGTEDEIRPLLSVLPSSPVTVVTLGEHARTALARYGCPADRKHGALFRLSTPDGSPLQAFVLTAAGDSFLYYADETTTLRVG